MCEKRHTQRHGERIHDVDGRRIAGTRYGDDENTSGAIKKLLKSTAKWPRRNDKLPISKAAYCGRQYCKAHVINQSRLSTLAQEQISLLHLILAATLYVSEPHS